MDKNNSKAGFDVTFNPTMSFIHDLQGLTGAGMSLSISDLMKKHPEIILDPEGEYLKEFYRPVNDVILNPVESRCSNWSVLDEIDAKHVEKDMIANLNIGEAK